MDKEFFQFTREHFFTDGLFEDQAGCLEEADEGGKSILHITCSHETVSICNLDSKNTGIRFFRDGSTHGLSKRVDHIVFENYEGNNWYVHLIEMKSGVTNAAKWYEIKAKFRASYLLAKMIGSVLEINITRFFMYTTYHKVNLKKSAGDPALRKAGLGVPMASPEDEWGNGKFSLNINGARRFRHIPVLMERNKDGVLEGSLHLSA